MRKMRTQEMILLIVDDEELIARAVARQLRQEFKRIDVVSSVSVALEALRRVEYDLVLSDWNMPGGGGKAILFTSPAPVVVYTANLDFHNSRDKESMSKAAAVVGKPASRHELMNALRHASGRDSARLPQSNQRERTRAIGDGYGCFENR